MKGNKKLPAWDDGRTVVNMNVEGMPWYRPDSGKEVKKEDKPTRKERRAMIRAGYLAYLPRFLTMIFGFGLTALLLWLWLNGWQI